MKKQFIKIRDLYDIKFIRELSLSHDGECVAFTVEWMNRKENKYFSNLYVVKSDGKEIRYVGGNRNIKGPKWSPDGKYISFIMSEKDEQNIWFIRADGGEAYALTRAKGSFGEHVWSMDSKNIYCEFTEKKEDKERQPDKKKPPLYRYITRSWYKFDGQGFLPDEKPHIWEINARGGNMKQVTFGLNGDGSPAISPDNKKLAYVSNRYDPLEEHFQYTDIFVLDLEDRKEKRIATTPGPKHMPVFSPDSKKIAYIGRDRPERFDGWRKYDLWMVTVRGGRAQKLTKRFDRSLGPLYVDDLGHYAESKPVFSSDGRFIYHNVVDHGRIGLFAVDTLRKEVVKVYGDDDVIYAFNHNGNGVFCLAIARYNDPGSIYLLKDGKLKKIIDLNRSYANRHRVAVPEEFWFRGDAGDKVQGWLMKPPNFNPKRKYPLIVQIHGGPHASYGLSLFHEFQVLAANGYIVFYSNPHGSQGYGEKFARALHNRWGIPDSKDIMKALKLLSRNKFIDMKRIGVMGGSYGGFMTNWLIGHTNVFKAAITMRCVSNMLTFFSHDFGFAMKHEFKGPWWKGKNFKFYWDMSPLKYVTRMKTPLLIIHSEEDHRCPINQAEELFVALKILNRDVEMVRFPDESHGLSRHGSPRRREKRLEFIVKFLDRHLNR